MPGTLADGQYLFTATAGTISGLVSPFSTPFTVTVDNTPPAISSFGLDAAFDARPYGHNLTMMPTVRLDGQTEPGATVKLVETGAMTTADASGNFSFYPVNLPSAGGLHVHGAGDRRRGQRDDVAEDVHAHRQHAAVEPASARRDAERLRDDGPGGRHGHVHGRRRRRTTASRSRARSC